VLPTALLYSPREVQTITVKSEAYDLSGFFRVEYEDHTTPALAHDISADDLKAALEALPSVGTVNVERVEYLKLTGTDPAGVAGQQSMEFNGYMWTVEFVSNTGYLGWSGDIPEMTVSTDEYALHETFTPSQDGNTGATVSAGGSPILCYDGSAENGENHCSVTVKTTVEGMAGFEQQTVTISTTGGNLEGTFTLTFEGKTTNPLAVDVSAGGMKAALEGLGNMGRLDVTHEWKEDSTTRKYTIVFKTLLGNQPAITYNKDLLSSSIPANSVTVQINEEYVGVRPAMTSSLKGTKELTGADIADSSYHWYCPAGYRMDQRQQLLRL
jgi:hypothetical protein